MPKQLVKKSAIDYLNIATETGNVESLPAHWLDMIITRSTAICTTPEDVRQKLLQFRDDVLPLQ